MKKQTAVIIAVVLAVIAAGLLMATLTHHSAGARKVSTSACETRMREDYQQGVTRTSRPAECKGVSTSKLQQIAGDIMTTTVPEAVRADDTAYLRDVAALSPELLNERSSADVDALGRKACEALQSGTGEGQTAALLMDEGLSADQATTVTAAAEKDYCLG